MESMDGQEPFLGAIVRFVQYETLHLRTSPRAWGGMTLVGWQALGQEWRACHCMCWQDEPQGFLDPRLRACGLHLDRREGVQPERGTGFQSQL